jgi:hypothetical protein
MGEGAVKTKPLSKVMTFLLAGDGDAGVLRGGEVGRCCWKAFVKENLEEAWDALFNGSLIFPTLASAASAPPCALFILPRSAFSTLASVVGAPVVLVVMVGVVVFSFGLVPPTTRAKALEAFLVMDFWLPPLGDDVAPEAGEAGVSLSRLGLVLLWRLSRIFFLACCAATKLADVVMVDLP